MAHIIHLDNGWYSIMEMLLPRLEIPGVSFEANLHTLAFVVKHLRNAEDSIANVSRSTTPRSIIDEIMGASYAFAYYTAALFYTYARESNGSAAAEQHYGDMRERFGFPADIDSLGVEHQIKRLLLTKRSTRCAFGCTMCDGFDRAIGPIEIPTFSPHLVKGYMDIVKVSEYIQWNKDLVGLLDQVD